jgi:hypothetical protein
MLPEPFTLAAAQVVAVYDAVETSENLTAAHIECDRVCDTFNTGDRGRIVRAVVAATSRVLVWRAPKCADCG